MHYGFATFGGYGMVLFWIIIIAAVIFLIKVLVNSSRSKESGPKNAMDILKNRYAAGEITRDEFEEKKRDLVGK